MKSMFEDTGTVEQAKESMSRGVYLLRFDDLCPTMNWSAWDAIEEMLLKYRVKPLLAVVPDNRDPKLNYRKANPSFWSRVRQWQAWGWEIAVHGYQHLYTSANAGIVGRRKQSEFAGIEPKKQREKLRKSVEIFQNEGIVSRTWIAPGHTFDETTVALLAEFGFQVISDGMFRFPRRVGALIWIPQQLWEFRKVPPGVWTICFHHNSWNSRDIDALRRNVGMKTSSIVSVDDALRCAESPSRWRDLLYLRPHCGEMLIRLQLRTFEYLH